MVSIGSVFLMLTVIKILSPQTETLMPVDEIGMKLYRPIFFHTKEKTPRITALSTKIGEYSSTKKPIKQSDDVVAGGNDISTSADESYFLEMIQEYKTNVFNKRKYRNDVVVRYYRHASDGDRVRLLVDYGFYLHVRPVGRHHYKNLDSNVIYFGQKFPEKDLKLIAYLLVKNGIPIKQLQPFKNYNGWKKKAIEIGGRAKFVEHPTLTFSEIRTFKMKK